MILKEFNLEEHIKSEKAYSLEIGRHQILHLTQKLLDDNRLDDLARISSDAVYLEQLLSEYNLD